MASKTLFKSNRGPQLPVADTLNLAGGVAYSLSNDAALAQYAVTGCLNSTFYATDDQQLQTALKLAKHCDPEFIARLAVYSRTKAYMKDLPALLCVILAGRSPALLETVFPLVINDMKMLRNFVQIMRSGVTGRKSLGSKPKRLVRKFLASKSNAELFLASVGNDPSLADVIKMVHPKPTDPARAALYAYLIGKPHDATLLPAVVTQFETFKSTQKGSRGPAPEVPMQMLTSLDLSINDWKSIARRASWQMTRMNLNTFMRQNAIDKEMTKLLADRLRNPELIAKAKVFPYQLLVAFLNASKELPHELREALQDAMEVAIANVPEINGKIYVLPDVSGSMRSPVTGVRKGATTAVRCVDVAALVAAAFLRKNRSAEVIPFSDTVVPCILNSRDSVMTNAKTLASLPSGGTNCSAPLQVLNNVHAKGDLIIYVSDNESWMDTKSYWPERATETMAQWHAFKSRNPAAKLVCIDLTPNATTQVKERDDVLNIGGFSDTVFDIIASFARGELKKDHWVGVINAVSFN